VLTKAKMIASGKKQLPALPALLFLIFFFLSPLLFMFGQAFFSEPGGFSLAPLFSLLQKQRLYSILRFTLFQAFLSVGAALVLGLPGAWLLSRYQFPGRKILLSLSIIPFILPPILVVLGFIAVFGRSGFLNSFLMQLFSLKEPPLAILYSLKGIILAHGFYNFPVVLRIVASALLSIPKREEDAASLFGASAFHRFRTIILPRIMPALLSSMLLVFLFCFSSFAVVLVLGGGPEHSTLEVEIYRLARIQLDMAGAALLAILSAGVTLLPLLFLPGGKTVALTDSLSTDRNYLPSAGRGIALFGILYSGIMVLFILLPILSVFINGFIGKDGSGNSVVFTLRWFTDLFSRSSTGQAVAGTLLLGSLTLLFTIPLATGAAISYAKAGGLWKKGLSFLFTLPMALSSVILGAAYLALSRLFSLQGGNLLLIAASHSIIAFPFVFHTIASTVGSDRSNPSKAAISLGATPIRAFFDVELPRIEPALFSAAAFSFALSAGEINATLTFSGGAMNTIPIAIYRLIGAYRFNQASALGSILILISALAFLFLDRRKRG
jgi:thiamine transport system permease protein